MSRRLPVILLAWSLLATLLGSNAMAAVDLALSPSSPVVPTGAEVRIALTATSDSAAVAIGALDAIILWDHTRLELLGFDSSGSPYAWFVNGFLPSADGINNGIGGLPFNDGNAKYSALSTPGLPAVVPPAPGLLVVEFRFRALAATPATTVQLTATFGSSRTAVFANSPPNTDITGDIDNPATIEIIFCSPGPDTDSDGFPDSCDNCPSVANPTQLDSDNDGLGDACDNCPFDSNVDQLDGDGDGVGDACDNCPDDSNPDQLDSDSDGLGDACDGCPNDPDKTEPGVCGCGIPDTDTDSDGVPDCIDNCPDDSNPDQLDSDSDGVGDACDGCPNDPDKTEPGVCGCGIPDTDTDSDGVPGCIDNCPTVPNVDQADADGDGVGDACDTCPLVPNPAQVEGDANGDTVVDLADVPIFVDVLLGLDTDPSHVAASDVNCDGEVNALDIQPMLNLLL